MTEEHAQHEHLYALDARAEVVREFMEWLCRQRFVICEWKAADPGDLSPGAYEPVQRTIDSWLAQFAGFDIGQREQEKAQVIREIGEAARDDEEVAS